jgi:hypothetical protein
MSFLAPLFLAGALAVGLPIIFHLIRRSTKERTIFSSLMFLHPSPPLVARRSRLEHLLLLLLRCAVVVLLATGFARPFLKHVFPEHPGSNPPRQVVVLLDTSASMRRQGLFNEALQKVEALVRQAGPADELAVFAFDLQLRPLITFQDWNGTAAEDRLSMVRNRLADVKPGWASTHLDTALIETAELFGETIRENTAGTRRVILIADLQEGSQLRALQGHEWPKGVEVVTERVATRTGNNAGIQLVADAGENDFVRDMPTRVRVNNASDSKREQFQLGWAGPDGKYVGEPIEIYVPAGQSRLVSLRAPGTSALAERIALKGDDEPFDDTIFVLPTEKSQTTVVYFGEDSESNNRQPLFFLKRGFQQTSRREVRVLAQPLTNAVMTEVQTADMLIVSRPVSESEAKALREAVRQGKTLLFAPVSAAAASSLGPILGVPELHVDDARPNTYAMFGRIEFGHPLFAPFADARFSDFTKIHFWKYRKIDIAALSGARIVAEFDTGEPAIVEVPSGKGRVVILASCWHPADSQLALSSKFVPLLYSLLEYSGASPPAPAQYFIGATVPLGTPVAMGSPPPGIQLPDGSNLTLQAGATNFSQTLWPGVYSIRSALGARRFAVNLEPSESRTAPLPADELERLGVPAPQSTPMASTEADRKAHLHNAELESRQKLWRWFILATLAALGMETWLAGRTARRGLREKSA